MKKVIIFGGSGFIGKHLANILQTDYDVTIISRRPKTVAKEVGDNIHVSRLRTRDLTKTSALFEGAEAVINLAGENVGERWNKRKMSKIKKSRLDIDNIIVRATRGTTTLPKVVMLASSVAIYGFSRINIDIAEDTPVGQRGFLPKVAISHEDSFEQLEKLTRVVYLRIGNVLDANEGELPRIVAPYKYYLGGRLGSGEQWSSWIHINDTVRAIKFLIENENSKGAYNICAPNPIRQKDFAKQLGIVLNRPSFFAIPSFLLRIFVGQMADELLLNGLRVVPKKLIDDGFNFKFENIEDALEDIYAK